MGICNSKITCTGYSVQLDDKDRRRFYGAVAGVAVNTDDTAYFLLPDGRCLAVNKDAVRSVIELGGTQISYYDYVLILQKQKSPREGFRDELFKQK
jgi:hypothetical protein